MDIAELYKSVAQLGFEDSLEDDTRFFQAANRALLQVNKLRPAIGCYLLNHHPLKNLIVADTLTLKNKMPAAELTFEAENAKSYYFEADGSGIVFIDRYNQDTDEWATIGDIELDAVKKFKPYKGFIKDGDEFVEGVVRLRFEGDYLYSVRNIAMYDVLYSDSIEDIPPYGNYIKYDMNELVDDFMTFSSPLMLDDNSGTSLNQKYEIEGRSTILLPYNNSGLYKILYEKQPVKIEKAEDVLVTEDDTKIDLDEELCSLLPNLIAAYVWCDDEPEKAQYYMNLYRERVQEIERLKSTSDTIKIQSVNGW